MPLSKKNFDVFTTRIKELSGIVITSDKEYLLESRLMPLVQKYGLNDLNGLANYLKENKDSALLNEIVECMTINESSFFRDIKPFDYLRDSIIPKIISTCPEKNKFHIWSAASSTGQEAYSIAMTLAEMPLCKDKIFEIYATDIDPNVLETAREGLYTQFEVQRGVPIIMLIKYFTQENGDRWRIKDNIKQMVKFEKFNLLDKTEEIGMFDIIFCRNVLIYFDNQTKEKVLVNISKVMEPHAYLFTGGTESLIGVNTTLQPVEGMVSVFR